MRVRKGMSLPEVSIVLTVLATLSATLVPTIGRYVRNAKLVRAEEDVQGLSSAIWMFIEETGHNHFLREGATGAARPDVSADNRVDLLVGDGDVPALGPGGDSRWLQGAETGGTDAFEHHLVTNEPGGGQAYRTPTDLDNSDRAFARSGSGGFNSEFAWRGPYMTAPIDPDPWGDRYAANVQYLDPQADTGSGTATTNGYRNDVVVLSAGPDEEVDTQFALSAVSPGDDDVISAVSANSRP